MNKFLKTLLHVETFFVNLLLPWNKINISRYILYRPQKYEIKKKKSVNMEFTQVQCPCFGTSDIIWMEGKT